MDKVRAPRTQRAPIAGSRPGVDARVGLVTHRFPVARTLYFFPSLSHVARAERPVFSSSGSQVVVIDARGHMLGRLASIVSKQLLQGQHGTRHTHGLHRTIAMPGKRKFAWWTHT